MRFLRTQLRCGGAQPTMRILYGGSVKPDNAASCSRKPTSTAA